MVFMNLAALHDTFQHYKRPETSLRRGKRSNRKTKRTRLSGLCHPVIPHTIFFSVTNAVSDEDKAVQNFYLTSSINTVLSVSNSHADLAINLI